MLLYEPMGVELADPDDLPLTSDDLTLAAAAVLVADSSSMMMVLPHLGHCRVGVSAAVSLCLRILGVGGFREGFTQYIDLVLYAKCQLLLQILINYAFCLL